MLGVLQYSPQTLMVVVVHQAISVVALHPEVALDHQLQTAIKPMNLLLMLGVQILGHLQHLEYWHQIRHHLHHCVLAVQKQDLVAHSYPGLLTPCLIIQWHGVQLEQQKSWYGFLKGQCWKCLVLILNHFALKYSACFSHQEPARLNILNILHRFMSLLLAGKVCALPFFTLPYYCGSLYRWAVCIKTQPSKQMQNPR